MATVAGPAQALGSEAGSADCILRRGPWIASNPSLALLTRCSGPGGFASVRFGSPRFVSVRLGSPRFASVRFGSPGFAWIRLGSPGFASFRLGSPGFDWVCLGMQGEVAPNHYVFGDRGKVYITQRGEHVVVRVGGGFKSLQAFMDERVLFVASAEGK